MKIASTIARYLLGLIFLTFGLNGFLHFIPMPPPTGVAAQFFGALFVSALCGDISFADRARDPVAYESLCATGPYDSGGRHREHTLLSHFHGACRFAAGCVRYGLVVSYGFECAVSVCRDPSTVSKGRRKYGIESKDESLYRTQATWCRS